MGRSCAFILAYLHFIEPFTTKLGNGMIVSLNLMYEGVKCTVPLQKHLETDERSSLSLGWRGFEAL